MFLTSKPFLQVPNVPLKAFVFARLGEFGLQLFSRFFHSTTVVVRFFVFLLLRCDSELFTASKSLFG